MNYLRQTVHLDGVFEIFRELLLCGFMIAQTKKDVKGVLKMIEIKIYSDSRGQVHSSGTVQELLQGIRILDTCRERILINIKEQAFKEFEGKFPYVSKERKLELIDETIKETLESITVLAEVNDND